MPRSYNFIGSRNGRIVKGLVARNPKKYCTLENWLLMMSDVICNEALASYRVAELYLCLFLLCAAALRFYIIGR